MSGGHWNYKQSDIKYILKDVSEDNEIMVRFPRLSKIFGRFGSEIYNAITELDRDLESDSPIEDDIEFENQVIQNLREVLNVETEIEDVNAELDKIEERFRNIKKLIKE